MACNLEPLLIDKADFDCIGQVAKHCDWDQLCIYIREQQNLSLLPKLGQCLWNVIMCHESGECVYEPDCELIYENLICGGNYIGCDGQNKIHFGVKRMLVHYAYGAYVYRHGYQDTPFGVVQKINQDSVAAPLNELRALNTEHRNNAEYYWEMTKGFLCSIKDVCPFSQCIECCDCKCDHCKGRKTKQDRGLTFFNVSKFD